ncbi:26S proteasome subunit RPN7-domain-containing protein [Limtongia smithiae]|uniref:26S proteasome subunit RPN7-domain-containing protein n=1 Tax=Limtongia smithiae TaxID=1125753 RepID=UPI0034CFCC23
MAESSSDLMATGSPRVDLETYISNYTGRNAVDRLLFIADRSPALAQQALELAVTQLIELKDVPRYESVVAKLASIAPASTLGHYDRAWADRVARETQNGGDRLEMELKSYKNNLIKESIRMGYADLGDFSFTMGDLTAATKFYSRQREYCTTHKHIEDMALDLIRVGVHQKNWSQIESAIARLDQLPSKKDDIEPFLRAVRGLWSLSLGNFLAAAATLVDLKAEGAVPPPPPPPARDFDVDREFGPTHIVPPAPVVALTIPAGQGSTGRFGWRSINEFMTINDVAVIVGLCMLATYSRNALKDMLDSNTNLKELLEAESHVRTLLESFILFDYKSIFTLLEKHKGDYELDMWLGDHVEALFRCIRENCYKQYVKGYKRGFLSRMADRFGDTPDNVERHLASLIGEGTVNVKLDLEHKYFIDCSSSGGDDERAAVYAHVLKISKQYERDVRQLLISTQVIRGRLDTKDIAVHSPTSPTAASKTTGK